MTLVELYINNLELMRGGEPVLAGVNLQVSSGEAVQIFGRNGAGKSSLLLAVAGLTSIASGTINWGMADGNEEILDTPADQIVWVGHQAPTQRAKSRRRR